MIKANSIITYLKNHKLIVLAALSAVGGWYYYSAQSGTTAATRYVLAQAERGTIIATVSGSGQVSDTNQLELKPKVSADIAAIKVKAGQKVKKGDVLAQLDGKELRKSVEQARNSLAIAKAGLDLKLAGLTSQELLVSQKSVDSAKIAYETSQRSLETAKLTTAENLRKAQLSLSNAQISLANAQNNYDNSVSSGGLSQSNSSASYDNAYANARNVLSTSLLTMRNSLITTDGILGIEHDLVNSNLKDVLSVKNLAYLTQAKSDYVAARDKAADWEAAFSDAGPTPDNGEVDALLQEAVSVFDSIKQLEHSTYGALLNSLSSTNVSQGNLDSYRQSISSLESGAVSAQNQLESAKQSIRNAKNGVSSTDLSASGSVSSSKLNLQSAQNAFETAQSNYAQAKLDNQKTLESAQNDVVSKKNAYETAKAQHDLKTAKPRDVDIASSRLQVAQAATSYRDAVDDLASATIKSPIDAQVALVSQKVGDAASPATAIVTLVTNKQMAEISLNEVDVAKVKSGMKATVTFSAVEGLEITGEVADIDALGTVNSGVVSYNVNIVFDTQDSRIKPGMSVSAMIVTDKRLDVLKVPTSAIKTDQSGANYVEVLTDGVTVVADGSVESTGVPEQKIIEIGLADDANTEVKSGLGEGDKYVSRTVTAAAAASTQQSGLNLFGGPGSNRSGNNAAMRALR